MENEIYVTCHGPSFSLLLYETVRSAHDQKGLLIGEVCTEVIARKTDENEMNREQKTTIYLEHCIPIQDRDFIGNAGNVNKHKLQRYIELYKEKIVGWYSFRRNTRVMSRTMREMLIHRSLIEVLPHVKPDYLIAAFMTASVGANFSTHTFNHVFTRFHADTSRFEPLKFKIHTMSDKISSANGYSGKYPFPVADGFERIIDVDKKDESPKTSMLNINEAINNYLRTLQGKLLEAERQKNKLEMQIKNHRQRLSLGAAEVIPEEREDSVENAKEVYRVHFLRYDSDVNYNPERKESPIKIQQKDLPPLVPETECDGDASHVDVATRESVAGKSSVVDASPSCHDETKGEKSVEDDAGREPISNHFDETGGNGDGDEIKIESESNPPDGRSE